MLVSGECVVMKESEIVVEIVVHDVIIGRRENVILPRRFGLQKYICSVQIRDRIEFVHGINLL